jgi:hypothetical protein
MSPCSRLCVLMLCLTTGGTDVLITEPDFWTTYADDGRCAVPVDGTKQKGDMILAPSILNIAKCTCCRYRKEFDSQFRDN